MRIATMAALAALLPVLLSGCGDNAAAPVPENKTATNTASGIIPAATAAASPAPQAAPAFDWAGEYKGDFDGGDGKVSIASPDASGRHKVNMSVVGDGCSGELSGTATASNSTLVLKQRDDNGEMCAITMTRAGKGITVAESGCFYYHGMTCAFVGTATKIGGGSSAAATPSLPTRAALIGGWVAVDSQCASGDGMKLEADGTYSTFDEGGRWTLSGATLTFTALEAYDYGETTRIAAPKANRSTIIAFDGKILTQRLASGAIHKIKKC